MSDELKKAIEKLQQTKTNFEDRYSEYHAGLAGFAQSGETAVWNAALDKLEEVQEAVGAYRAAARAALALRDVDKE